RDASALLRFDHPNNMSAFAAEVMQALRAPAESCGHARRAGAQSRRVASDSLEFAQLLGNQIVEGHAALRIVTGHGLGHLGHRGFSLRSVNAEFLDAPVIAYAIEFLLVAGRHKRGIAVSQRDAEMLHDLLDHGGIRASVTRLHVCKLVSHLISPLGAIVSAVRKRPNERLGGVSPPATTFSCVWHQVKTVCRRNWCGKARYGHRAAPPVANA